MRYLKHARQNKAVKAVWPLWLLVLLTAVVVTACEATPAEERCDICVVEELQAFYEANGGEAIFGEPHTRLMVDRASNRRIQYFDGVRMEFDPNNPSEVFIAELGEWAFEGLEEPLVAEVPASNPSRTFPNGYVVQGAFLEFYEAHNGEEVFGQPISNQLNEGFLRVQYFENVRLEWHPDAPPDRRVQVGFLGRAHYLYEVYDPSRPQLFLPDDSERVQITDVTVTAAVSAPTLYGDEQQTIFIIAESSDRQPVEGLEVMLTITDADETYTQILPDSTDARGTAQGVVEARGWEPGEEIHVAVSVSYEGNPSIGTTSITFKKWWSN